ncbi:ABC transporter substrate-binding protein [Paenibacillus pectinilyticus]|uniref:ABC transporter substrate-binding protein n=1 Tax=Paenibacillus pectinilyticus TaxID=512399 RepID=A0A1C1A433_9BACL|nr:ABC transporter substrate-binding protein [Paenibacillus pectinilyticus]OCT15321.1 ABC transporter substrate-binding protein [Paenibacillus pectinilyticus]
MVKNMKMISIALAATLAVGLTACSSSSSTSSNSSAPATAAGGKIDTSEFQTISYVMLGDKPKNGQFEKVMDKINVLLKQKVNAKLEIKWVEWADWQTKYNLLLASGEPVDLITGATDWLDTWQNSQKGAFMALDKLLPTYAPITWKEVPTEDWAETKYKNQIMLIPEDHYTQWVNHGFMYRGDWAKEFGITSPITDWATLGKYLQGVKDKKPGVVPWDTNGTSAGNIGGYINSYTDAIELPISTGLFSLIYGKSYTDKYKAYSPFLDSTFVDFAKMMKDWGDKGFWREDVLNYKGDNRAEMEAGKASVDQHHTQTYLGERIKMDKLQPGSDLQFFPFSAPKNNLVSMSITHGGTSLGAKSKHPERALMVYELIRQDPEIYHLMNYGLEGVQYVVKDGKRFRPDGYNVQRDDFYSDFWGGRIDKNEIPNGEDWVGKDKLYASYDKIKKAYPYGRFVFDKTNVNNELTAITQVVGSKGPAIMYGKAGDPVKAVEDFRASLKAAGFDKVMAEVQKQLDEFKKLVESSK